MTTPSELAKRLLQAVDICERVGGTLYCGLDTTPGDGVRLMAAAEACKQAAALLSGEYVRQRCGECGGPHQFDTSIPSVLWNRIIRPLGISEYLCASCILKHFADSGESFHAELYGGGFRGLPISVEVNGALSNAVKYLNDQNNELRAMLAAFGDDNG